MFALFKKKQQQKVFREEVNGTIHFIVEVGISRVALEPEFLRLQPKPKLYRSLILDVHNLSEWQLVPAHIEKLGLTIVPAYQEFQKVFGREETLDNRISGLDRQMRGLPPIEIDPALHDEKAKCEVAIKQFWQTCDRLYERMLKELELDLCIYNSPNESLSKRLEKVNELLDTFECLEIEQPIS
ncbi:hypothetical protein [Acaryochloris sp. CCMEE 5410]|uniref:hypothetical protein n=1 Tax=Acaryochloris sp. CCMEE 5410 TaxID=310037 RepID=UPI0002483A60|nr:hypothetical protein [Acaryochloris sp. CCMEE 5410]KAI9129377.1 hypothetical protein ON05_035235 [Acaryochloris sp. CCMEE 5410]